MVVQKATKLNMCVNLDWKAGKLTSKKKMPMKNINRRMSLLQNSVTFGAMHFLV